MATRLENILLRARDTLSDPDKDRWTNARLLRLADEAHKVIAARTAMLKVKADIPLLSGQADVSLPDDVYKVTRILNENGQTVKVLSHSQADKLYGIDWELQAGSPIQAVIFDKTLPNVLKVYPEPDVAPAANPTLTTLNSIYGVTVAGGLESKYDKLSSLFGVVVGVSQVVTAALTIYYNKIPSTLLGLTDELEISPVYDAAMKFYICGMALRDDKDTQNRALGSEELQFFAAELREARVDSSMSFLTTDDQYEVPYVGGV